MMFLHYFLGFPPMRSGGLTRYAVDLMKVQNSLGYDVSAVYPKMNLLKGRRLMEFRYKGYCDGIARYEMHGALPIPLLYGVKTPNFFMEERKNSKSIIKHFFENMNPDVVHIHTLMGLPIEFLEVAKELGIRIVYTSHDYFGICPRVNFIDSNGFLCGRIDEDRCSACNRKAWSRGLLWLRNSYFMELIKKIRR